MSGSVSSNPVGLPPIFDSLRAEREAEWLSEVFVPPPGFEEWLGERSILLFGARGAGKTAARLAMIRHIQQSEQEPTLVVEWQFGRPPTEAAPSELAIHFQNEMLDRSLLTLLEHAARAPDGLLTSADWVPETLIWLLHRFFQKPWPPRLRKLRQAATVEGWSVVQALLDQPPSPWSNDYALEPHETLQEFEGLCRALGFTGGVWLIIDGMEPWLDQEGERLEALLHATFSTLAIFEVSGIVLKVFLPPSLRSALVSSGAVSRGRLETVILEWDRAHLMQLVERRLAHAFQREPFSLTELCDAPGFEAWLTKHDATPHAWLTQLRPLVAAYRAQGQDRPLTQEIWQQAAYRARGRHQPQAEESGQQVAHRQVPNLFIDANTQAVHVGDRTVENLSPQSFKLLNYLYQKQRLCTRSELYYRALQDLSYEPRSQEDKDWEAPTVWSGTLDTAIGRLRAVIEPTPRDHVYIVTVRGKGYRLEHTMPIVEA